MKNKITIRSLLLGTVFSALFAVLAIRAAHLNQLFLSASQMPEASFVLLFIMVLLINPVCRLIRFITPFSKIEMMIVFIMGMVSAGISSFGLAHPLAAHVSGLFYGQWNNRQSEWAEYVVPFVNEAYFLAEPGIRKKALKHHEAFTKASELQTTYNAAFRLSRNEANMAEAQAKFNSIEQNPEMPDKQVRLSNARLALDNAGQAYSEARKQWLDCVENYGAPDRETVLSEYPDLIAENNLFVQSSRKEFDALQEKAFQKVALFRQGLPDEKRAYPGILILPDDDISTYRSRLQRLITGRESLKLVLEARETLASEQKEASLSKVSGIIDDAVATLSKISDASVFETRKEEVWERQAMFDKNVFELRTEISELSNLRRDSRDRSETRRITGDINSLQRRMRRLQRSHKNIAAEREVVTRELAVYERMDAISEDLGALSAGLTSSTIDRSNAVAELDDLILRFPSIDASLRRFFVGDVPWRHWVRPFFNWAILIALTYIVLMTFNVLIFRQWAHNEKLTYPLMEIPKALVGGAGDGEQTGLPPIFKNPLFWGGVIIPVIILGWNLICSMNVVPGLKGIDLRNEWWDYLSGTTLSAWRYSRSQVFFTAIGLAFLIPKNISFSLWFFHIVYLFIVLVLVTGGYGYDERSFRANWWHIMNFRNAIGGGALVVFSAFVLYKCKQYILCCFSPASVSNLEADERRELRVSSFLFLAASAGLVAVLWLGMGANLFHTIFMYFFVLIVTIGLVRVVCEGGLPGFNTFISPFHFVRNLFGLNMAWTSATLFTPLIVYYAVLFADIKSFIAPAMANSLKLRDDFKMKRGTFHLAVAFAIVAAVVAAVMVWVLMGYDMGADRLQNWFANAFPKNTFDSAKAMIKDAPDVSSSARMWMGVGAGGMAVLMIARQFVFWLPHPLGLIMFITPAMGAYWFSIMIGWLANVLITKYAHKQTYHKAAGFFLGLIIGELIMVVISSVVAMTLGVNPGIDLNRN